GHRPAAGLVVAGAVVVARVGPAAGQAVDTSLWVTDGQVSAVALSAGTVYIGGGFTNVGPPSGGCQGVSTASGVPVANFPKVAGLVFAAAPDGSGGWYIGGYFSGVG